jgi:transcriptional regulator with XRE-family HTH domain
MYDCCLMNTVKFRGDRLATMMEKRNLKPGQLEYMAEVSQPMISLLLSEQRPNVSAVIVARLADALGCSVEYLVGLTDDPSPVAATLDDAMAELVAIAKTLPEYRQRDLLAIANTYQATGEPTAEVMEMLLDQIEEVGGEKLLNQLLDVLEGMLPPTSTRHAGRRAKKTPQQSGN